MECKNLELTNENNNLKENFIIKTSHNIDYNKHSYKRSDYMKKEFDNNNINSEKLKDINYRKNYFLELVNRFPAWTETPIINYFNTKYPESKIDYDNLDVGYKVECIKKYINNKKIIK